MENMSGGMKSLCEDISLAHGDRKRSIKDLEKQAKIIRDNARKFVNNSKKLHGEMAKDLRKSLTANRKELIKNVASLREDFREKEEEIRSDLAEASKIWSKMNETLKRKKRGEGK